MNRVSLSSIGRIFSGFMLAFAIAIGGVSESDAQLSFPRGIRFQSHYGGVGTEAARAGVLQTGDRGYVMAGESNTNSPNYDIYVVRTDENAWLTTPVTTWGFQYHIGGDDYAHDIQQTSDGGFIVTGRTTAPTGACAFPNEIFLLRLNSTGGVVWCKTYGSTLDDQGWCVRQTSDGGFIVAGRTNSFSPGGDYDAFLMKTNSSGTRVWAKTYGGTQADYFFSCLEYTDGTFIATGSTQSFRAPATDADVFVIKADQNNGSFYWANYYGWGGNEGSRSIRLMGSDLILAGNTTSFPNNSEGMLVKLNGNGGVLGCRTVGGANSIGGPANGWDEFLDVSALPGKLGYVVTGLFFNPSGGFGSYDAFMMEIINDYNTMDPFWFRVYGGTGNDQGWSVAVTKNGYGVYDGVTMAGLTNSFATSQYNQQAYLVRANLAVYSALEDGHSQCNFAEPKIITEVRTIPRTAVLPTERAITVGCTVTAVPRELKTNEQLCINALVGVKTGDDDPPPAGRIIPRGDSRGGNDSFNVDISRSTSSIIASPGDIATALFPNPVKKGETFMLEYAPNIMEMVNVTITDLTGREIFRSERNAVAGRSLPVSTEGWPAGVYMIRMEAVGKVETRRVVVADK